jgi:hypothetical protein
MVETQGYYVMPHCQGFPLPKNYMVVILASTMSITLKNLPASEGAFLVQHIIKGVVFWLEFILMWWSKNFNIKFYLGSLKLCG